MKIYFRFGWLNISWCDLNSTWVNALFCWMFCVLCLCMFLRLVPCFDELFGRGYACGTKYSTNLFRPCLYPQASNNYKFGANFRIKFCYELVLKLNTKMCRFVKLAERFQIVYEKGFVVMLFIMLFFFHV